MVLYQVESLYNYFIINEWNVELQVHLKSTFRSSMPTAARTTVSSVCTSSDFSLTHYGMVIQYWYVAKSMVDRHLPQIRETAILLFMKEESLCGTYMKLLCRRQIRLQHPTHLYRLGLPLRHQRVFVDLDDERALT